MVAIRKLENTNKPGLYSAKQLFIASIAGGPVIAGFIIAFNLWAEKKKILAIVPALLGFLFDFVLIIPVFYITRNIGLFSLRNILAIALLFIFQTVFAFIIRFYLKNNKKTAVFVFREIDEQVYHRRKIFPVILISIIYFVTDLAFPFYSWIVLALYLFPHFYCYSHIYTRYGNTIIVKPILAGIVLLACFLPFVFSTGAILFAFQHKENSLFTTLNLIAGFYAVIVLYIFIIISGLNILLLINRLIRLVPIKFIEHKRILFFTILIIIVSGSTITGIGSYINNNPVITKYSITLPRKSSTLHSLKVICVADLHLKNITSTVFLNKLVNKIRQANPDVIVLPGDFVESGINSNEERLNQFFDILKNIKARYGIYAIKGNHDYPGDMADKIGYYKRLGITMLTDSLIEIDSKFCVIGLKYRENNEKRPIDSLLKHRKKDLPILLLDHAPFCLEEAYKNKIDIQFSGHTHYGQIWPFNYIVEYKYDIGWGYKKNNATHVFVSCGAQDALLPGIQDVSIPVRIGSVSEIIEVNIEFR